jgi:16S rRNA (uracil1498-N3)-methyltransferase
MTLPRFFVDTPLAIGASAVLPRAVTRHALRALRLRDGDRLTLFNGRGGEYACQLVLAREPEAGVEVLRFDAREAELPWPVTVAQGLSSGDRMDWTVEKAVELGAAAVAPLAMARSVTRLAGERARSRQAHWQSLVIAASQQCGRNRLAEVEPVTAFDPWLATLPDDSLRLVLAPLAAPLRTVDRPRPGRRIIVLAGPEGGITDQERAAAEAAGFHAVSLGPRVLRTETAAAVALAMMAALWEVDATPP